MPCFPFQDLEGVEEFIRENQDKLVAIGEVGKKCNVPYYRKLTLHEKFALI